MKSVLLSVRPQHVANILNRLKTLEIRKKFPSDYVGWVYIYCCKQRNNEIGCHINYKKVDGKVVARFWCDKVEEIKLPYTKFGTNEWVNGEYQRTLQTETMDEETLLKKSCLSEEEIYKYLNFKHSPNFCGYAIHITKLEIFDKPKEIKEFYKVGCEEYFTKHVFVDHPNFRPIYERELKQFQFACAPQSWCYVEI